MNCFYKPHQIISMKIELEKLNMDIIIVYILRYHYRQFIIRDRPLKEMIQLGIPAPCGLDISNVSKACEPFSKCFQYNINIVYYTQKDIAFALCSFPT